MTSEERIARIEALVDALVASARRVDPSASQRGPTPEDWSVVKVLAHTAELLSYWAGQARDVAARSENNQPFGRTHDDPDRIKAVEDHAGESLDGALQMVQDGLRVCVETLRAIPEAGWQRTGRHARRGEMAVGEIVDQFLVDHLEEHRLQTESTLARLR